MKDVMCPACNTRSVAFWGAFRKYCWGWSHLSCDGCGAQLRYPGWVLTLHFLFGYFPFILVGLALVSVPYVGFLLLIPFIFGLTWLAVRFTGLRPIEKKP